MKQEGWPHTSPLSHTRGLGMIKKLLRESSGNTLTEQLELEKNTMRELGQSHDYREGVAAFMEKRPAKFQR